MSPILAPLPVPHPVVRFARAIETAALATLDQDPATMASGSLGVVTREAAHVQPEDATRDVGGKSEVPLISVRAVNTGTSAGATAGSRTLTYRLELRTVTEHANTTTARQQNDDVQGVAVYALLEAIRTNPNTWIDVEDTFLYVDDESTDMDTPAPRDGMPHRFESTATIPISVLWSNVEVW